MSHLSLFDIPSLAPPRDDQKTPSTEIFLDENRLSGIIIYSDTIPFTMIVFTPTLIAFASCSR
jgi:hypothetical protein